MAFLLFSFQSKYTNLGGKFGISLCTEKATLKKPGAIVPYRYPHGFEENLLRRIPDISNLASCEVWGIRSG